MEKIITLQVNDLLTMALQYLGFIDPFNHLSDGEKQVLARIMVNDNAFIEDKVVREKLLLDYDVKISITLDLDITEARLYNILASLRKKEALIKTANGYSLHPAYDFSEINLPYSLTFKWDHGENKEQNSKESLSSGEYQQ